jgi:dihydroorotase
MESFLNFIPRNVADRSALITLLQHQANPMKVRFNQVKIVDPASPWHRKVKSILVDNGIIQEANEDVGSDTLVIEGKGCEIMPGFCEMYAASGDPGHEYRETLESLSDAAAAGGVTAVCVIADNDPVSQHKTQIEYFVHRSKGKSVEIWPIGAITEGLKGKNPTEMYDMHYAGAVAFSDAPHPVANAGVMLRALQYVQPFDGVIMTMPFNQALSEEGQINEGWMSVRLGMKGIPHLAETIQIKRDLDLLAYSGGRLHFSGITTAEGVKMIREAKESGLQVTAGVFLHHLLFNEEDLIDFDTNFKVVPPLRTERDTAALMAGIQDGTIDVISTQHIPLDTESKRLEFEYALPGMANLEYAFALANTVIGERLSLDRVVELFSIHPRKILRKPTATIQSGAKADFILTDASQSFKAELQKRKSLSANTPFADYTFKGMVKGLFNNGQWLSNE